MKAGEKTVSRSVRVPLTALVLAACLIFGACAFAEESESCPHDDVAISEWMSDCTYAPKDAKKHYKTGYVEREEYCLLCYQTLNYEVSGTSSTVEEKHWFENGQCIYCEMVNGCPHEYIVPEDDSYIWMSDMTYTDNGDGTHKISGNGYVVSSSFCSVCKEQWQTESDECYMETTEEHYYSDGTCYACGAENSCAHAHVQSTEAFVSDAKYISVDEKTHRVIGKKQTVSECPECREMWYGEPSEEEFEEIQAHNFSEGACYDCGQENTCPHEHLAEQTEIRWGSVDYTSRDERYHSYSAYINHYSVCEDCGESLELLYCVYEPYLREEHSYTNGYCECGFVKIDDLYDGSVAYLPDSLDVIDAEALRGIAARTVVIPDGANTIGARAFAGCPNLKYAVIPESVDSIAGDAFEGCGDGLIIVAASGSEAERYAEENRISCVKR